MHGRQAMLATGCEVARRACQTRQSATRRHTRAIGNDEDGGYKKITSCVHKEYLYTKLYTRVYAFSSPSRGCGSTAGDSAASSMSGPPVVKLANIGVDGA